MTMSHSLITSGLEMLTSFCVSGLFYKGYGMKLTKKERKYYKKQLSIKLDSLGIKNEIRYKGTGVFKNRTVLNEKFDKEKPISKDNAPFFNQRVEMMQAVNTYKNLINTLIKQANVEVIEKFLEAEIKIDTKPEIIPEPMLMILGGKPFNGSPSLSKESIK